MRKLVALAVFMTIALALVTATAQIVQAAGPPATFTTQTYPILGNTHVAADVNGDGKPDLAGAGANGAAVMLNNGDGTFGARVDYPAAGQTQDVAAGDFNGDGRVDIVITINTPQIMLSLLTGNGDGTFNPPLNSPNTSGADSPSIVATDLNNDGNLDVAIGHGIACFTAPCVSARTISVMLGNGNGTFQPSREIDVGSGQYKVSVGDFNRDGIKDLALGAGNTRLYILLGAGNGTFVQQPTIFLVPGGDLFAAATDVAVADYNGDTIQDLAACMGNGNGTAILIGNGDGTFGAPFRILDHALDVPQSLAAADYNRDGFMDIARALANGTRGLIDILHGNGDGTFQPAVNYLVPPPLSSQGGIVINSADFNVDGRPDTALLQGGASASLKVSLNSTGAPPPPQTSPTRTPTRTATPVPQATATLTRTATPPPGATATPTRTPTRTPAPATDTVSITRAEYDSGQRRLRIEATSTSSSATLTAYVTSTNQQIGILSNDGGGRYRGEFTWPTNPQNITVRSSRGGSASRTVSSR